MSEAVEVKGMVLSALPYREYDKRITLLTCERGKITVFANGARKPSSQMAAVTQPFVMGTFSVYPGRGTYNLKGFTPGQYFEEMSRDIENTVYGSYFLELASYYTKENEDGTQTLNLLYVTFRALLRGTPGRDGIRRIFELRMAYENGFFPGTTICSACGKALTGPGGEGGYFLPWEHGIYCRSCMERRKEEYKLRLKEQGGVHKREIELSPAVLSAMDYIVRGNLKDLYYPEYDPAALEKIGEVMEVFRESLGKTHFRSLDVLDQLKELSLPGR